MRTTLLFFSALLSFFSMMAQFGPEQLISLDNENASKSITHDMDSDGFIDIISGAFGGKIVWHRNLDGTGDFGSEQIITSGAFAMQDIQLADFDGDGDMDIIYKTNLDKIAWLENEDGMGSFGSERIIIQNEYPYNIRVGDLDGDGDVDVLAVHYFNSFQERLVWYENMDGQGDFSSEILIAEDYFNSFGIQIEDLDNDGDEDIVACTWDLSPGKINLYRNEGAGNFDTPQTLFQFDFLVSDSSKIDNLLITDFNNDGKKDLLITSNNEGFPNLLSWLEGIDGLSDFSHPSPIYTFDTQTYISSLQNQDLDGDGDQDILLGFANGSNYGNLSYIINKDGLGNFSNRVVVTDAIERTRHVTTADIDNDDDLDVVVCSSYSQRLAWYENKGNLLNIEKNQLNKAILYPNPTDGKIYFNTLETIVSAKITNTMGALVKTTSKPSFVNLTELPSGIYFVTLTTEAGKISVEKIIKR